VGSGGDVRDVFRNSILEHDSLNDLSQPGNPIQFPPVPLGAFYQPEQQDE
jgi:hypothetical protein